MNQEDIKINDDTIFQNADNQFKYANISDEYMAKQHISVLKDKLLYNPQYVYNELMSDEYKNNRFGSLEEFIKYINNNKYAHRKTMGSEASGESEGGCRDGCRDRHLPSPGQSTRTERHRHRRKGGQVL